MPDPIIRFRFADLTALSPDEGLYQAVVRSAHLRCSAAGNETIQVLYDLADVDPEWDRVSEYFVLSGPNPRAIAISRYRILSLCRACGREPEDGEELNLRSLAGLHLVLRVGHETYDGRTRLRVLAHQRCQRAPSPITAGISVTPALIQDLQERAQNWAST